MDIEALQTMNPMVWIIIAAAIIISIAVLLNKAVKFVLKLAVIVVVAFFVLYFLVQANVIVLPEFENSVNQWWEKLFGDREP